MMNKKAFTLIEMIVVIAIIAILSGVIILAVSAYLPSIQLNGASKVLTSKLREAQERAVTEQNQHLIRFHDGTPPYYELIRIFDSSQEVLFTKQLPPNAQLTLEDTITDSQIIFSPDGGPSSNGDITLTLEGSSKIINVSSAGFIKN